MILCKSCNSSLTLVILGGILLTQAVRMNVNKLNDMILFILFPFSYPTVIQAVKLTKTRLNAKKFFMD